MRIVKARRTFRGGSLRNKNAFQGRATAEQDQLGAKGQAKSPQKLPEGPDCRPKVAKTGHPGRT